MTACEVCNNTREYVPDDPRCPGHSTRRCARCLEILGAEQLRDIPDRKVAGAGEEQLVMEVLEGFWKLDNSNPT